MSIGDYYQRFQRLEASQATETTYGERKTTWAEGSTYWGYFTSKDVKEEVRAGAKRAVTRGTITLQGYPTFSPLDRVVYQFTGDTYEVTGVGFGDWETVLQVESVLA